MKVQHLAPFQRWFARLPCEFELEEVQIKELTEHTVLLRVFPLVLRALAFLAARVRGLAAPLALWQASRNPTHVARLVLLFSLAIALGILTTGLNATLDQSEYDRATYLAGNDLRFVSERAVPLVELQSKPSTVNLSGTWRGQGTVNLKSAAMFPSFDVLESSLAFQA